MEEKTPTRQVGYRNPDGSVTYILKPKKWINPTDKTAKQILLEIGNVICNQHTKDDVEDLLQQAADVLWQEFQDNDHPLYCFIREQLKSIQVRKNHVLRDIAKESRFRIEYYFENGE